MYGFDKAKDILDVIVIPISIFVLGLAWPWWQRYKRRLNFYHLLRHELKEMQPIDGENFAKWSDHLDKRFINEIIFLDPSQNREFILSIAPEVAYSGYQLWSAFLKADKCKDPAESTKYGKIWVYHLKVITKFVNYRDYTLSSRWKDIVDMYAGDHS